MISSSCISCLSIAGGNGKASSGKSCNCIRGYRWSTNKCICDSNQNFVPYNNICF